MLELPVLGEKYNKKMVFIFFLFAETVNKRQHGLLITAPNLARFVLFDVFSNALMKKKWMGKFWPVHKIHIPITNSFKVFFLFSTNFNLK